MMQDEIVDTDEQYGVRHVEPQSVARRAENAARPSGIPPSRTGVE